MSVDEPRARGRDEKTWPLPGTTRFRLQVLAHDGDPCTRFTPDGPVEVTILAEELPVGGDPAGRLFVVLPLAFPNYPVAAEHAHAIGVACTLLETAIAEAVAHADDPIPSVDDGHRHVVRFARYSRAMPFSAECAVCMHTLVPDVAAWARDRGLVNVGNDTPADIARRKGSIAAAIERVHNRDGGLAE